MNLFCAAHCRVKNTGLMDMYEKNEHLILRKDCIYKHENSGTFHTRI